jgi:uncharacterized protein YbaP (TraB family)
MKKIKVWVSGFTLLLAIGGFSVLAQEPNKPAAKTPKVSTKHSLWKVQGKNSVTWLLGSIHVLKSDDYPLPEVIDSAFTNAEIVAFETDIAALENPATAMKMLAKARLPEGQTLESQLSPEVYKAFMKHVTESGTPEMLVDSLKPAMAAMMVEVFEMTKLGLEPEQGIDKHFFGLAKKAEKQIVPLETVDFQIGVITEFTKEEGEAMMKATLKDLDNVKTELADMLKAWRTGDSASLDKMLNEAMTEAPAVYKRLVTDRNRRWVPQIEEFLNGNKNAIVIVGAAHLVGKEGVVQLLKDKGYKIVQE